MKDLLHKIAIRIIPFLVSIVIRLWFGTCTVTSHNKKYIDEARKGDKPGIATFWHYSIFYICYVLRKDNAVVMVSASKDGDYIANLASHLGFSSVRGSRNSKGLGALKQLIKVLKKGTHAGIVADGSQGPPRVAQGGPILLASRTNGVILPMAWSANRCIVFSSWDRTVVPKPFSKIDFYYGEPIYVPKGISAEEIEDYRQELEDSLNKLYDIAWAKQGKTNH